HEPMNIAREIERPVGALLLAFDETERAFRVLLLARDRADAAPAITRLLDLLVADEQDLLAVLAQRRRPMHPGPVAVIVVEAVPEAAGQDLDRVGDGDAGAIEIGIGREGRRRAVAEPGEDQPGIVARRMARDAHAVAEGPVLVGLLDALPIRREAPAVIAAAQGLAFDPA